VRRIVPRAQLGKKKRGREAADDLVILWRGTVEVISFISPEKREKGKKDALTLQRARGKPLTRGRSTSSEVLSYHLPKGGGGKKRRKTTTS